MNFIVMMLNAYRLKCHVVGLDYNAGDCFVFKNILFLR